MATFTSCEWLGVVPPQRIGAPPRHLLVSALSQDSSAVLGPAPPSPLPPLLASSSGTSLLVVRFRLRLGLAPSDPPLLVLVFERDGC